jgi:hypothetical protein
VTRTFAMKQRSAIATIAMIAGVSLSAAGCQSGQTGPSLSANFSNVTLVPTVVGVDGAANVCCCHLAGKFTNTSSITVDAELRFPAKNQSTGQLVGQGEDVINDVPAGESRSFLAVGITSPCSSLSLNQIVTDGSIRLKGLFQPAF